MGEISRSLFLGNINEVIPGMGDAHSVGEGGNNQGQNMRTGYTSTDLIVVKMSRSCIELEEDLCSKLY